MARKQSPRRKRTVSQDASAQEVDYSRRVESTALWALMISGVITAIVMFVVNADRESIPFVPDTGSVGFQGLILSILVSLILTPYAYIKASERRNRWLPPSISNRYKWSVIPITIAVTLLVALVSAGSFEIITRAFVGLELTRLAASLRLGTTVGIVAYVLVSWIMRMRITSLLYVAVFYLFATLIIAGATNENPTWYENSFSYLGMTDSSSKAIFNLGLPFTGLLIVIWSIYFNEFLSVMKQEQVITPRAQNIIYWALILTGILLSLVGIVRFGIGPFFNVIHDVAATGMGVVLGLLMLFMPKLIRSFPRVFYIYSYLTVVMLVLAVVLMVLGIYSLTGLEVSAFVAAGFWLLVFYRNTAHLVEGLRPGIRI